MTALEREKITEVISTNIKKLNSEITELEELTKPIPLDAAIGRISRMDAINNKTINDSALRNKRKIIARLERALDQSTESDFGLCQRCGNEIPFGRLEYMPHTTRCIHCVGK